MCGMLRPKGRIRSEEELTEVIAGVEKGITTGNQTRARELSALINLQPGGYKLPGLAGLNEIFTG